MASALSSSAQLLLLFLLISTYCFLLPSSLDAKETNNNSTVAAVASPKLSFSFDFSNASSYEAGDIRLEGNASVHGNLIDLACDSFGQSPDGCMGRMSYNHPVQFHDDTTLASFNTSFVFMIKPNNEPAPGDGIAFFISGIVVASAGSGGGVFSGHRHFHSAPSDTRMVLQLHSCCSDDST